MGDLLQLRDEHEQAQMLLPWRVNGTLEPGEAALLEAHLAGCGECREDLARNLALRRLYADLPVEGDPARPTVLGAIEAEPVVRALRWDSFRRAATTGWGRAAQAAVAAAAAVALVVVLTPTEREDGYRLLGSNSAALAGNAIVLFSPETPARDLRAALDGVEARLVDGPTASGAYVVHLSADGRAEALGRLRGLPQVVLAEPLDAADGP